MPALGLIPAKYETQASGILDHAFLRNQFEALQGNGFIVEGDDGDVGGIVTSDDTDMVLDYTSFWCIVGGKLIFVAAGTVTIVATDPSDPRMDIIHVTTAGAVAAIAGTPTTESSTQTRPPLGTLPAGALILAVQYAPATAVIMLNANIFDRRAIVRQGSAVMSEKLLVGADF